MPIKLEISIFFIAIFQKLSFIVLSPIFFIIKSF